MAVVNKPAMKATVFPWTTDGVGRNWSFRLTPQR